MKDVKEFATYVAAHLFDEESRMEETHNVKVHEVVKNNGNILTGITISEVGSNIAPTIYVNDGFRKYQEGMAIEDIIAEFLETYKDSKPAGNLSVDFFTDFVLAKERLAMKLINAEKNKKLLKDVPHYLLGDLAVIFQVQVNINVFGNAVITIRNEHQKIWDVSTSSLFTYAKENMEEKQPIRIQSMLDILSEMMGDVVGEMEEAADAPLYVVSNETKINGASAMIFTEKLHEFADSHKMNLFILPSSIHELIIVPDTGDVDADSLISMVCEVNATQVDPEEILSDNVYYYDRRKKTLMFAKTKEKIELAES